MDKVYRILTIAEAQSLDLNLLEEVDLSQARRSIDQTKVVVQYKSQPLSIDSTFYSLTEAQDIMTTEEWYDVDLDL